MDFNDIFKLFKSKYNSRDYGIAERGFPAQCVYVKEKRHKVVDTYRIACESGRVYFVVYKKKPIKERKTYGNFENNKDCGYFNCEINGMSR